MAESRKVVNLLGAAGVALFALTGGALADGYEGSIKDAPVAPAREFTYSFSATGTSDYVFRGISQTENEPAIQGAINIGYGIVYAGIWASNVDFGVVADWPTSRSTTTPASSRSGVRPPLISASSTTPIPGYDPGFDPEIIELKAGVSGEIFKSLTGGAAVYYSPDYNDVEYWVYEGTLAYALPTFHVFTPDPQRRDRHV